MRELQAVNRRILADDRTITTTTLMIITTTATTVADKTSGMKHIAIAIQPEDARTQAKKVSIGEEHVDLENLANRPKGQHIQDTDRGQVPLTDINSHRPALIGPIPVPEHQDSHPVPTLDITNLIATSNTTPAISHSNISPTALSISTRQLQSTGPNVLSARPMERTG